MTNDDRLLPHEIDQIEMDLRQEYSGVAGLRGWAFRRLNAAMIRQLRKGKSLDQAEIWVTTHFSFLWGVVVGGGLALLLVTWLTSLRDLLGWVGTWFGLAFLGFLIGREVYRHWRRSRT